MYHKQVVNFLFLQCLKEKEKKKNVWLSFPKDVRERERESVCRSGRGGGEEERKGLVHGSD